MNFQKPNPVATTSIPMPDGTIREIPVTGYTDEDLYWFMHAEGKRRFGSECKHEQVKGGHCVACLRKAVKPSPPLLNMG